jgi:hypothetical protein
MEIYLYTFPFCSASENHLPAFLMLGTKTQENLMLLLSFESISFCLDMDM